MKILTKEEEEAHYNATLKGGLIGGTVGLAAGVAGVFLGSMRFPIINHLTVPMKAFLITSTGTFTAITGADSASRSFESSRRPEETYQDKTSRLQQQATSQLTGTARALEWGREHRYQIVGGSWVASMALALGLVSRSPLSTAQKLVQARVYAQGLTVAVLIATAAFEISDSKGDRGRWETVKVLDPEDPTHQRLIERRVHHESYQGEDQWRDMVEAEERKLKERQHSVEERQHSVEERQHSVEEREAKHHKKHHKSGNGNGGAKKDEGKSAGQDQRGEQGKGGESKDGKASK